MTRYQPFEITDDYEVPLLRLLAELPGGQGQTSHVCDLFEKRYRDLIPKEHFREKRGKEEKWRNNVRWCRKYLKQRGFLADSAHGIWKINEEARRWLDQNPTATRITDIPKQGSSSSGRRSTSRRTSRR